MVCKYTYKGITYNSKEEFISQIINPQFLSNQKIRRVMELQSDLFQKGRLKEDLILSQNEDNVYNAKKEDSTREEFWIAKEKGKQVSLYNNTFYEYNGYYYDFLSFSDKYYKIEKNSKIDTSENQFLQLLNKDNNWVTFFVKSIIQDSAKKGYEKVLFPVGDTAAKIEGHDTVDEFIKNKQNRISELEKQKLPFLVKFTHTDRVYGYYNSEEEANNARIKNKIDDKSIVDNTTKDKEQINNEISQLEKEIEDAKAGKLKISSIAKFYEDTIANVLSKIYGAELITTTKYLADLKLPNTYQVIFGHPTIGKSFLSDKSNAFLSLDDTYGDDIREFVDANRGELTRQQYKGSKPAAYNAFMLSLFDKAKKEAKKQNIPLLVSNTNILKVRSSEFGKIITLPKEEFKNRLNQRGSFLAYDFEDWKSDIDATIASIPTYSRITDEYGNEWNEVEIKEVTSNPIYFQLESLAEDLDIEKLVDVKNLTSARTEDELRREHYTALLNKFADKFNLQWKEDNDQPSIGRFQNGTVYINFNKIKADTVFHEFLHPFEQAVKKQNPTLWKSLASRANKVIYKGTSISDMVKNSYQELVGDDLQSEIIVTALGLYAADPSLKEMEPMKGLIKTFLDKILKMIKSLFIEKSIDLSDDKLLHLSFRELTDLLFNTDAKLDLSSEKSDNTWFQKPDETFAILKGFQDKIKRDDATHTYYYEGKKADGSVHSLVVDPYYDKLFGDKKPSEIQQIRNETLAKLGNEVHKMMEDIFYTHIDPATGLVRDKVLTTKHDRIPQYIILENYFKALIDLYKDKNPRFMSEIRLYDTKKNMGGTTDLVIMTDDGIKIYDWKSIQTKKGDSKMDDIPFFKEEAYRLQLGAYKNMIENITGGKVTYAAAIPIEANVKMKFNNGTLKFKPTEFSVGDPDPRLIDSDKNYLLPVVFKEQTTGDKLLDTYVQRIYGMMDKISKESVKGDVHKRERKIKILNGLRSVIRSLQVRMSVTNFKETAALYIREAKFKLSEANPNKSDLLDMYAMLDIFRDSSSFLRNILPEIDLADLNSLSNADRQSISAIADAASILMTDLKEKIEEVAVTNASNYGIENLLSPQKGLDWLKSNFRSISTMPVKTVQTLWQMLKKVQNTRDIQTRDWFNELKEVESKFKTWATSKGQTPLQLLDKLFDHDKNGKQNGKFLRKYSQDFYDQRKKAIDTEDIAWILNNTTFNQEAFDKFITARVDAINAQEFYTDVEKNNKTRVDKINKLFADYAVIIKNNGQETVNREAIFNSNNHFLVPLSKYETSEWKYLHAKGNEPLLETYNKFQSILKYAKSKEVGMFEDQTIYNFIPNMQTDWLERAFVNGLSEAFDMKKLFRSWETNSDQGFMKLDPVDGKEMKTIPIYFTTDLVKKEKDGTVIDNSSKSTDLFKVFAIFGAHVYDYKMKSDLEDDANILLEVEKNKTTYQTNPLNHIKKDSAGNPIEIKGKGEASEVYKVLQDYVDFYVYGRTDNKDFVKTVGGKEFSGRKILNSAVSFMSLKTLSLNVPSAMANLFGGKMNAFFEASKKIHFNEKDHTASMYELTSADKKAWAMIEYLNVFLEDQRSEMANKLSLFNSKKIMTNNHLMIMQHSTDKIVQHPTALAMSKNYMVNEGKIVSIKKYVRSLNNYDGSYDRLSLDEKKALDKKIESETEALKKTKSIYATAEYKDGKLTVPGITEDSQEFANFRAKIKKVNKGILGNSTKDDITRIRLSMLGQVFMQFRNWMPQMVTERFGDYNLDPDLEQFTYGKTRMFFKEMFSKNVIKLSKDLIFGFGTNTIQAAKARYAQIAEELSKTGEDLTVTETEFIDLYISNLRSQMRELLVILAGAALLFSAFSGGDDDKDGWKKMARRAVKRLGNELTFYYSPTNFTQIVKSPFPVIKLLEDVQHLGSDIVGQSIGYLTGDEKQMKRNHPTKYFFNIFPITKEALLWAGTLDEDLRKSLGIKIVN